MYRDLNTYTNTDCLSIIQLLRMFTVLTHACTLAHTTIQTLPTCTRTNTHKHAETIQSLTQPYTL